MNTRSIHFRLILWYSALVVIVAVAFGAYTYHSLGRRLYEGIETMLVRRAEQIRDSILRDSSPPNAKWVSSRIEALYSPGASNRFIRIVRGGGTIFYVSGRPKDNHFNPADIPIPTHHPKETVMHIEPLENGFGLLIISILAQVENEPFIIELGVPTELVEDALRKLLVTLLLSLPVMMVIAVSGGYYLVRRALKPVEDIRATAEQITFGNLSNRLPVTPSGDALEHLSVTLNQMLGRLDDSYQQVSRFSADASHELRTPLTIMRAELESVVQEEGLPEGIRERIGSVLEESERLSRITESLFTISRLDAGEARMETHPVDLSALVRTTAEQLLLLVEEKQIVLEIKAEHSVYVEGDMSRLKQVIVNLLDNAIKYTPRGGKIFLTVIADSGKAVLEVRDNGIGIPPDALPHVFKRFYRADKLGSREVGGAGLGLPIVRSICQAHSGTVDIESTESVGTRVIVALPLSVEPK